MGWLRLVGSLKLQVTFAEYRLFFKGSFAKETYNFKEPTNRSHPICYLDWIEYRVCMGVATQSLHGCGNIV